MDYDNRREEKMYDTKKSRSTHRLLSFVMAFVMAASMLLGAVASRPTAAYADQATNAQVSVDGDKNERGGASSQATANVGEKKQEATGESQAVDKNDGTDQQAQSQKDKDDGGDGKNIFQVVVEAVGEFFDGVVGGVTSFVTKGVGAVFAGDGTKLEADVSLYAMLYSGETGTPLPTSITLTLVNYSDESVVYGEKTFNLSDENVSVEEATGFNNPYDDHDSTQASNRTIKIHNAWTESDGISLPSGYSDMKMLVSCNPSPSWRLPSYYANAITVYPTANDQGIMGTIEYYPVSADRTYTVSVAWEDGDNGASLPNAISSYGGTTVGFSFTYASDRGGQSGQGTLTAYSDTPWTTQVTVPADWEGTSLAYSFDPKFAHNQRVANPHYEVQSKDIDDINGTVVFHMKKVATETLDIPVRITWDDEDNAYSTRPDAVTVYAYANGDGIEGRVTSVGAVSYDISASESWEHTFTGLPVKDENGGNITYTFAAYYNTSFTSYQQTDNQKKLEEYYLQCQADNPIVEYSGTEVVLNYHFATLPATIWVGWDDNGNANNSRPESVTVNVPVTKSVSPTSEGQIASQFQFVLTSADVDSNNPNLWKKEFVVGGLDKTDGVAYPYFYVYGDVTSSTNEEPIPNYSNSVAATTRLNGYNGVDVVVTNTYQSAPIETTGFTMTRTDPAGSAASDPVQLEVVEELPDETGAIEPTDYPMTVTATDTTQTIVNPSYDGASDPNTLTYTPALDDGDSLSVPLIRGSKVKMRALIGSQQSIDKTSGEGSEEDGWITFDVGSTTLEPTVIEAKRGDTSSEHAVTLELNGGSIDHLGITNPTYVADGNTLGSTFGWLEPRRAGYTLGGWYSDPELTMQFDWWSQPITSDTTVYASWLEGNIGISFYDADNQTVFTSQTVSPGSCLQEPDSHPESPDPSYEFTGWYVSEYDTVPYDFSTPVWNGFNLYPGFRETSTGETVWPVYFTNENWTFRHTQHVVNGQPVARPQDPTAEEVDSWNQARGVSGYVFEGWYEGTDWDNLGQYDFDRPVSNPLYLYARFVDPNGSGGNDPSTVTTEGTITIAENSMNAGTTYDVYRVFRGSVSTENGQDKASSLAWDASAPQSEILSFLNQNGYQEWLQGAGNANPSLASNPMLAAQFISEKIADTTASPTAVPANGTQPRTTTGSSFATGLAAVLVANGTPQASDATAGTAYTNDQGYYLFVSDPSTIGNGNEAGTAPIWSAITSTPKAVTEKVAVPTLTKQVQDDASGSTYGKAADANIGQDLPYRLTATMPENVLAYGAYGMTFTDTLPSGMSLAGGNASSVSVSLDGTDITGLCAISYENDVLTVAAANLMDQSVATAGATLSASSNLVVDYRAHLDADYAQGSAGNMNGAVLTYSADPMDASVTSQTPQQNTLTYAHTLSVEKVDRETRLPLGGAQFTIRDDASGKYVALDGTLSDTPVSHSTDVSTGLIEVAGVDSGTYTIAEVSAPTGYRAVADTSLTITPSYDAAGAIASPYAVSASGENFSDVVAPATTVGANEDGVSVVDASLLRAGVRISDLREIVLPLTGMPLGMGIAVYGSILLAVSLAVYIRNKRIKDQIAELEKIED